MSLKTFSIIGLFLLFVFVAALAFMLLNQTQTLPASEWVPLNNGYPGWSNKVQPW